MKTGPCTKMKRKHPRFFFSKAGIGEVNGPPYCYTMEGANNTEAHFLILLQMLN